MLLGAVPPRILPRACRLSGGGSFLDGARGGAESGIIPPRWGPALLWGTPGTCLAHPAAHLARLDRLARDPVSRPVNPASLLLEAVLVPLLVFAAAVPAVARGFLLAVPRISYALATPA